ncbi:MAG: PilN domain-containing protein [Thermodesulfobacteriota bacterium]
MLQRINLVPQTPVPQKIRKALPFSLALLLLLIVAFLSLSHLRLTARLRQLDAEIARIETRLQQSTSLATDLRQLADSVAQRRQRQNELQTQVAALSRQIEGKRSFSKVLATISEAMPSSVKCDKLTFKEHSGLINGSAVQYRELPEFVSRLQESPLFTRVTLQDIDRTSQAAEGRFLFTIAVEVR